MKKLIFILIILLFVFIGCKEYKVPENEIEKPVTDAECTIDSDCTAAGCSGQLCLPKDKAKNIMTTCEFKAEYECLRLTSCSCVKGKCGWVESEEYKECLEDKKGQAII